MDVDTNEESKNKIDKLSGNKEIIKLDSASKLNKFI